MILRRFWQQFFSYDWKFGLFLILLFGIPRFILVLQTNTGAGYGSVSYIFLLMWIAPFIFLTKEGRKYIGIRKPKNILGLFYSFLAGAAFCLILFLISKILFANTVSNSFVYISRSYTVPVELLESQRFTFFLMFSLVGITFSPIGEELLYRGIIHGSFVGKLGETKSSYIDSLAFALTHLAHFGIIYNSLGWEFLPLPSLLWVCGMFLVSQVFFRGKQYCNSIFGAIISHAGYNVAMTYIIFYWVL